MTWPLSSDTQSRWNPRSRQDFPCEQTAARLALPSSEEFDTRIHHFIDASHSGKALMTLCQWPCFAGLRPLRLQSSPEEPATRPKENASTKHQHGNCVLPTFTSRNKRPILAQTPISQTVTRGASTSSVLWGTWVCSRAEHERWPESMNGRLGLPDSTVCARPPASFR